MTLPTPFDLTSHTLPADKQQALLALFPEIRTEGGKIDFDRLKLALGETVDTGRERYGLTWPGKADCFKTIQAPSTGTLRPCPEESVNFDTTENLIIEGDNLEVLKLLQKAYLGKVKMIYIDPPYNTGNDFIYPDNYTESLQTYLEYTGQVDSEGRKFSTNSDTDGRFHSKWINMMYPRLFMARNLLSKNGVVFVSIDDNEVNNLRHLMDELFGAENFLGCITVVSNWKGRSDDKFFATAHNYLIAYSSGEYKSLGVPLPEEYWDDYPEIDNEGRQYRLLGLRKRGAGARREDRPNMYFPIFVDPVQKKASLDKSEIYSIEVLPKLSDGTDGRWRWGRDTARERINELLASQVGSEGRWDVFQMDFAENESGIKRIKPKTVWMGSEFANEAGTLELKKLLGKGKFDNPKPVGLVRYLCEQALEPADIVLDFFAGSGTTAQAVLEINQEDNGNRKFILIQLPEPTGNEDFPTIADITKERVRRVIQKLNDEEAGQLPLNGPQDRGFRVFKLAESNFNAWNAQVPHDSTALARQLELHIEHVRPGRTSTDILYELLLKSGYPLTTPVEEIILGEKQVFRVADGLMLVCLEKNLTLDVLRAIADLQPERVVCLDTGFADDALKTNAVQIFKTKGIVFRTV